MTTLLVILIFSLAVAAVAIVYSCILTDADMLLGPLYTLSISHLPAWLHKPLISCERCVAGQMAFWMFPFWMSQYIAYDWFFHICFISFSILFTSVLKAIYYSIIKQSPKAVFQQKKIKKPIELL